MLLPSFVLITMKYFEKSAKNVISDPKNGCHFPRSRSFDVKFTDKVSFTPSNVQITTIHLEIKPPIRVQNTPVLIAIVGLTPTIG